MDLRPAQSATDKRDLVEDQPAAVRGITTPHVSKSLSLHLILIIFLGLFSYMNTFHAPFQWDDAQNIIDNPVVRDMGYFADPSRAEGLDKYKAFRSRYIGYLSFALNYKIGGLDARGFHIANLAIHISNAILVYCLVILTFRTPLMSPPGENVRYLALMSALLFVSHPLQTQAVTYIVQRFASMAALFCLISVVAYAMCRLSGRAAYYVLSAVSAVAAMKTKECAVALPLLIALYELSFFRDRLKRRVLLLAPLFIAMLVVPMAYVDLHDPAGQIVDDIADAAVVQTDMPALDYRYTELRAIVTYIRLLVLPFNQNLDYDYQVAHSIAEPRVLLSALFLAMVFGLGVYMFFRSRRGGPGRLAAFGLFWFFLALIPESGVITIVDVIFEHRTYMPGVGFFIAVSTGAFVVLQKLDRRWARQAAVMLVVVLPLMFGTITYTRNDVWKSAVCMWEDIARKSPSKPRAHYNLGNAYAAKGRDDMAMQRYLTAIDLKPDMSEAHNNLGNLCLSGGRTDEAIEHFIKALSIRPDCKNARYNLGNAYAARGWNGKAIDEFNIVLSVKPDCTDTLNNIGIAHASEGRTDEAIECFNKVLGISPDNVLAHYNLGVAYASTGQADRAIEHYRACIRLDPGFSAAEENLARILRETAAAQGPGVVPAYQ
jgi:tetratricopeptide (TPR) repeat protein